LEASVFSRGKGNNNVGLRVHLRVILRESGSVSMGPSTTTVLPVAVGIMNVTQLMEPTMEEDSGLVAGIVIAVVTVILILAALVSRNYATSFVLSSPITLHATSHIRPNELSLQFMLGSCMDILFVL
jgi:hypothetical protein